MDYPGKVITKNQVTPTQTSATGVWTLDDAAAAVKNNNWPVAGVPNPISKSLRFNSADSAYLNRTFGSVGNRTTWTYSVWLKRSSFASFQRFLSDSTNNSYFRFNTSDVLDWNFYNGTTSYGLATSQVFRDPSAWYHIIIAVDTTQATSSNRVKIYVNGSQVTAFSSASYPPQNATSNFNNNTAHYISSYSATAEYFNGYLTEINFIDGQALTPSSFGMTDPVTGVWEPLKYSGTYGTNGFYLNFKDATSTTTLGYDYSGNSNNWTTNNFSVTAGSGNDSLTDVPTPWIAYNTTGDVGGVVRGNYCTLNPLDKTAAATLSNGNLQALLNGINYFAKSTIAISSGKWYWEVTASATAEDMIGITKADVVTTGYFGSQATSYGYYKTNGNKYNSATGTAYGASYASGDIIGVALDLDAGTLTYYKNGVSQGTAFTGLSGTFFAGVSTAGTGGTQTINFGQRPFDYTPPSGYLSLCTTNLPASTVLKGSEYFDVLLYAGNNASPRSLTGLSFAPDFGWLKRRTAAADHQLFDIVRGVSSTAGILKSNTTDAESSSLLGLGQASALTSDGFTVIQGGTGITNVNSTGDNYVSWLWKANGAGVTNTAGSITSTVSANTTSGFSIVTYTGTGANATVGHGLGVAPDMVIVKKRSASENWAVYHTSIGATKYLTLNLTDAETTSATRWNNTAPTSTVFSIGTSGNVNDNTATYVAYCFDAISGFSAFGSYTGNGSADGPFVYTGFRPKFWMGKRTDSTSSWIIMDSSRNTYNVIGEYLLPNSSNAEASATIIDFLSNGVKFRGTSNNDSGSTWIYAAFAENPFKNALAR